MKNIVLFDTSSATLNHGDEIIMESFLRNGADLLDGHFVTRFPTHAPCFHAYQQTKRNPRYVFVKNADCKFICGTNLLSNKMYLPWHFWNVNLFNCRCYKDAVLVGVGCSAFPEGSDKPHWYSKLLFSKVLSKKYKHSVRDERTKRIVESICGKGSAINTGCPTLWGMTAEHCRQIPTQKAKRVVFTLSDYSMDRVNDQALIDLLHRQYETVYFWPQGTRDLKYFQSLSHTESVRVVSPSVQAYGALLDEGDIDFVGTRLHAGIYAMQHKVRSVILAVDNRAADMAETYNLNVLHRGDPNLEVVLSGEIVTAVNIDEQAIAEFKQQFV
ncbi:MAG: polysaccharide pyruvyl transferase family protein [Clostridia bacterium]|nr:polysaccharide pyruvyl transferase family protein [Clostridia bacterium]